MSKHILIVEDNPPESELMCYLLTRFGFEPEVAATGEEALQLAAEAPPDLVLCDLRLPGIDGYEVTHRLRQQSRMRGKSIVAVSGTLRAGDEDRLRAEGFDGQIPKPLVPETLLNQIQHFLPPNKPAAPETPATDLPAQAAATPPPSHGQNPHC